MATIVVFGGTGYTGDNIVREAAARGHQVVAVGRSQPKEPVEGVRYEVGSAEEVAGRVVPGADAVVAALSPRGDMAGRLVEVAAIADIIARPRHPYTRALIGSLPSLERRGGLSGIPGLAPSLRELPAGCAFHPRCPDAVARCRSERPVVREVSGAAIACHLA